MSRILAAAAFALACLAAAPASAQFRNPLGGGSSSGGVSAEGVISSYVALQQDVLGAQEKFSTAFGMKDQAEALAAERAALSSGSLTGDDVRRSRELSERVDKALAERMAQEGALSAEGQGAWRDGLVLMAAGTLKAVKFGQDAAGLAGNLNPSAALGMVGNGRVVASLARGAPDLVTSYRRNLGAVVSYGRKQGVQIPADATSLI